MNSFASSIFQLVQKYPLRTLMLVFLLVQCLLYFQLGVNTGLEAEKYVAQGQILYETGSLSESKFVFYLPVILLVWLCKTLDISLSFVVLIQVLIAGWAQYYFYRLVNDLADKRVAFLCSLLLILFIPLQSWNFFLYSDSIFISFTLIYAWVMYKYASGKWKVRLLLLLTLFLLILSRPHGLLFVPPTVLYLLLLPQSRRARVGTALACLLLLGGMYSFMNLIFTGGSDMDALKPFVEEHIICFVPQKPEGANLDIVHSNSPVYDLLYYIVHNPLHFLRLMGLRLLSFFNLTRGYYSFSHNLFLIIFMIPVYLFSIWGIGITWRRHRPFVYYVLLVLILYPLGATFQCDDWHSRFTMVVIPYFIFFAVTAISRYIPGTK